MNPLLKQFPAHVGSFGLGVWFASRFVWLTASPLAEIQRKAWWVFANKLAWAGIALFALGALAWVALDIRENGVPEPMQT